MNGWQRIGIILSIIWIGWHVLDSKDRVDTTILGQYRACELFAAEKELNLIQLFARCMAPKSGVF